MSLNEFAARSRIAVSVQVGLQAVLCGYLELFGRHNNGSYHRCEESTHSGKNHYAGEETQI